MGAGEAAIQYACGKHTTIPIKARNCGNYYAISIKGRKSGGNKMEIEIKDKEWFEKILKVQLACKITDHRFCKLTHLTKVQLLALKSGPHPGISKLIHLTHLLNIPASSWGLDKIRTGMIERGFSWGLLSAKTGFTSDYLRKVADQVSNNDFHVKRESLKLICQVLRIKAGLDFRTLYGLENYNKEFGDERQKERAERLKGVMITGKCGSLKGMKEEEKAALFERAENSCAPEAREPGFNIHDFIQRQADRLKARTQ